MKSLIKRFKKPNFRKPRKPNFRVLLKKRFLIPIIIFVVLAGWFLGTGLVLVSPHTVKVVDRPVTIYLRLSRDLGTNLSLTTNLVACVNDTNFYKLGWKGPIVPSFYKTRIELPFTDRFLPGFGVKRNLNLGTGTKEVIDLNELNIDKKFVMWSMDRETGKEEDKYQLLAIVVKGELKVSNWDMFVRYFNPEKLNAELEKQGYDIRFSTIDYWINAEVTNNVVIALINNTNWLTRDKEFRCQYLQSLIESHPELKTPEEIKEFLTEEEPFIYALGVSTWEYVKANPQGLAMALTYKVPGAIELYQAAIAELFLEQSEIILERLDKRMQEFQTQTKPELKDKAEFLFSEFEKELNEKNQSLSTFTSESSINLALKQFLEGKDISKEEDMAFEVLVEVEWNKALILRYRAQAEVLLEKAKKDFKKLEEFKDELNDYWWELISDAVLNKAPEEELAKLDFVLLKSDILMGRVSEHLEKYFGYVWGSHKLENISIELKEKVPLFINGEVDPDFKYFYEMNKDKYQEQEIPKNDK